MDDLKAKTEKEITFFEGIPADMQGEILKKSKLVKKSKGSILFHEGDQVSSVWLIKEGSVKLTKIDAEGREQIIGIFSDLEVIWEGVFIEESKYPFYGICTTPVKAYVVKISDFEKMLANQNATKNIIILLSKKLHDANQRNIILSTNDPEAKIAGLLLYHQERNTDPYVSLKLNEIAASLNLRAETVSRKLRNMEKNGVIKRLGQGKIKILDYEEMQYIYNERDLNCDFHRIFHK